MSNGWTVLLDRQSYDKYRDDVIVMHGMFGHAVNWGEGPSVYPCLIAYKIISPMQVICCYCLPADAEELLSVHKGSTNTRVTLTERQTYDRQVTAMIMALLSEQVDIGVTNQERFQRKYNEFLQLADQDASMRKELSAKSAFAALQCRNNRVEDEQG